MQTPRRFTTEASLSTKTLLRKGHCSTTQAVTFSPPFTASLLLELFPATAILRTRTSTPRSSTSASHPAILPTFYLTKRRQQTDTLLEIIFQQFFFAVMAGDAIFSGNNIDTDVADCYKETTKRLDV